MENVLVARKSSGKSPTTPRCLHQKASKKQRVGQNKEKFTHIERIVGGRIFKLPLR